MVNLSGDAYTMLRVISMCTFVRHNACQSRIFAVQCIFGIPE